MPKRYNLNLPDELYDEVEAIAKERSVSVVAVLKQFIKLGLLVAKIEKDPNSELIIREGEKEKVILLM